MKTAEIKRRFLAHFEANGHTVVPSIPLPNDDPNLLFVNAGMNQFVPYFVGQQTAPWPRAASVQKCIRTPDIDEVGKTTRHGTFFQMNGNFSFGDYFKDGAIRLAWELSTRPIAEGGFGFDPDRIWVTVLDDGTTVDDEAIEIWHKVIGLPMDRIVGRGKLDNYWHMGIPGPGGPCSELYYDRGPTYGPEGGPAVDEDRFMEFWNLVFMQEELAAVRAKDDFDVVGPLPAKNIDTGMGLERVAALLQGVDNLYEIDEVRPILDRAAELTGKRYNTEHVHVASASHPDDVRLRVIADHVRTALMVIGDGVIPSNEGRGYVLRRILRRAIRSIRLLGFEEPALPHLLPVARDCMAPSYPEVAAEFDRIAQYAYGEEEAFLATLRQGTTILDTRISAAKTSGGGLSGDDAFLLHDTYGFPIDLTLEIAGEQGLSVDEDGFRRLMADQRKRAKADAQARKTGHTDLSAYRAVLDATGAVEFTGYVEASRESTVRALLGADGTTRSGAGEGEDVELILDATPFYAEGGGQQPDTGIITVGGGSIEVYDVQQPIPGLYIHRGKVTRGEVRTGEVGHAEIDVTRRRAISRSHTATHLVHQTMRNFLGDSSTQAGSLNAPGRLRFDFNTPGAVPPSVLADVEQQVNEVLMADLEVHAFITSQEEAKRLGAIALFGEKYGDEVRVVEVGDYARELCGGTHVARSGQLGLVKILNEASIGSGVRRVEALVGIDAFSYLAKEHLLVARLAEMYRAKPEEVADRVEQTVAQLRAAEKELEKLRAQLVLGNAASIAANAKDVAGVAYVGIEAPEGASANDARTLATEVRGRLVTERPGVVAVAARAGGKVSLVAAINGAAKDRGLSAASLVKEALGGRGGGNADMAQGGGLPAEHAPMLLATLETLIAQQR